MYGCPYFTLCFRLHVVTHNVLLCLPLSLWREDKEEKVHTGKKGIKRARTFMDNYMKSKMFQDISGS